MRKKLIIGFLGTILLISLLPFPQKIDRFFYGVNIENGESVDITLDMKYLRFLFLKDKLYGEISVSSNKETVIYGDNMDYIGLWPSNNEDKTLHAFFGWYFNPQTSTHDFGEGMVGARVIGYEMANAYISRDFNKILLYHKPSEDTENPVQKQYIGNVEENKGTDTLQYFEGYVQ